MDFKINDKIRHSNIQYVRSSDGLNDAYKSNNCLGFFFRYKTSFIAALFSIVLTACFIMMMIYISLESDNRPESLILEEKAVPISSQISLRIDPKAKDAVLTLTADENVFWQNFDFTQDNSEGNRQKRQAFIPTPDCRGKKEECTIVLDGVRGITKAVHQRLDRLQKMLIERGILSDSDPKDAKFRKIVECLQCRSMINPHVDDEMNSIDGFLPGDFGRNANDRIKELLPLFESHIYSEDNDLDASEEEDKDNGEERSDRVPKNPPVLSKQVMESTINSSKVTGQSKITEILHNTTIVENDSADQRSDPSMGARQYMFHHRPVGAPDFAREESQVTRNMDATPIILPTAETTKTSQQIQFSPQGSWPNVPVCFYAPPSSSNSNQFKQGSPFFLPYGQQGMNPGMSQQIKFFPPNSPLSPYGSPNFPPMMPPQFPAGSAPPSLRFPMPMMNQMGQMRPGQQGPGNLQYYCTFMPAPTNYQQQFPAMPNMDGFPSDFVAKPKDSESATKENTNDFQQQFPSRPELPPGFIGKPRDYEPSKQNGNDHQQPFLYKPNMAQFPPGFFENPTDSEPAKENSKDYQQQLPKIPNKAQLPYGFFGKSMGSETKAKEISKEKNQHNEGKSTYDSSDEKYLVKECSGFWCKPPYKKCISWEDRCDGKVDCIGAEDEIGCPYIGYYSQLRNGFPQASSPFAQQQPNTEPPLATKQNDEQQKSAISQWSKEGPKNDVAQVPTVETTENYQEVETTTLKIIIPDMPEQFACKRITQTIPMEKRCDNVFDCEDTSDEENCTCKDYLRRQYPAAVCDGQVDCYDGSDEEGCDFCKENQYHCYRSGTCIPKRKRCDQNMDCKLNEDELDCFALTDGQRVNLDLDKRPLLNLEGVLTRYENGAWIPSCFKSEFRNQTKRASVGQKICEYLGFKNLESAEEITVPANKLVEKPASKDIPINYENLPRFAPSKRETNKTCYGLYLRCKPILDRKLNVHLKVDPKTKERTYQWPWEASIFVDGKYHCSTILLENNLLLSNEKCGDGIDLHKNYTTALLGVSSPDLPFNSPYQQSSQIVDIKPVKNSDASLFRMKDNINMTRYVQPLYLEKRIFPASKDDTCVALGVNDKHERKMTFLQPVIDNCPKCHRCYIEKSETSTCSKTNETVNWNGNVVCLSSGGWYPAAVFQDKDESCGFANKQILNSIDYIHAHLSQAIDEQVEPIEELPCDGIRCSLGQCIRWDRVCDGVRDCQDGADESRDHCEKVKDRCENDVLECKCSKAELRCGNGKCVPKEKFCDGKIDCTDGTDEPASCTCVDYLKLTEPRRVCDGRRHCMDKSDENYQHCLCKDSSFKCQKSPLNGTVACIPQDFVCDGEVDCPQGEDEEQSVCWSLKTEARQQKGQGEVMKRTFGILQSVCLPRPLQSQREVTNICTKMGYTSGMLVDQSTPVDAQFVPRDDFYMFQLNNYTWMTMRNDVSFGVWEKPSTPCNRLIVHCF